MTRTWFSDFAMERPKDGFNEPPRLDNEIWYRWGKKGIPDELKGYAIRVELMDPWKEGLVRTPEMLIENVAEKFNWEEYEIFAFCVKDDAWIGAYRRDLEPVPDDVLELGIF